MSLDNGPTDGQPDTHAATLRCVEGLEKPLGRLRLEADSGVFHAQPYPIDFVSFGSDEQLPWPVVDGAHCVRCIPQQVQDDLLKLHSIALNGWQADLKVSQQQDSFSLKLIREQRDYLSRCLVQIQRLQREFFLAEQRA